RVSLPSNDSRRTHHISIPPISTPTQLEHVMRTPIALALLFGLTLSAYVAADEKSDQDKIQGKWKMESGVKGGTPIPDDKKNVTIEFAGNKMKALQDGKEQVFEMTFKLDPSKKPKAIDVDMDGKPGLGIYVLDGDTLK